MRKTLLPFLCLILVVNSHASLLVFKATKDITNNEVVELASFDASKYKQIRVGIKTINRIEALTKDSASFRLKTAQEKSFRVESDAYSQAEKNEAKKELDEALANRLNTVERPELAGIYGIEETSEILLFDFNQILERSFVIDSPPGRISIKAYGKGTYKIFVWASL